MLPYSRALIVNIIKSIVAVSHLPCHRLFLLNDYPWVPFRSEGKNKAYSSVLRKKKLKIKRWWEASYYTHCIDMRIAGQHVRRGVVFISV